VTGSSLPIGAIAGIALAVSRPDIMQALDVLAMVLLVSNKQSKLKRKCYLNTEVGSTLFRSIHINAGGGLPKLILKSGGRRY
jgi:hypothetical protein